MAGGGGRGRCPLRPALPVLPTYYDSEDATNFCSPFSGPLSPSLFTAFARPSYIFCLTFARPSYIFCPGKNGCVGKWPQLLRCLCPAPCFLGGGKLMRVALLGLSLGRATRYPRCRRGGSATVAGLLPALLKPQICRWNDRPLGGRGPKASLGNSHR
jgi:hypothetical protein